MSRTLFDVDDTHAAKTEERTRPRRAAIVPVRQLRDIQADGGGKSLKGPAGDQDIEHAQAAVDGGMTQV